MSGLDDEYEGLASGAEEPAEGDEATDAPPASDAKIILIPDPPVGECPVVPLGHAGRNVVFAMPEGEIRAEAAANLGKMLTVDIFACIPGQAFLTYFRTQEDDKLMRDVAVRWLVRQCRAAGPWDTARPMRGLGVWPGPGDTVVLHRGEEILEFRRTEKMQRIGITEMLRRGGGGPLYRVRPRAPMPDGTFTSADGARVREDLEMWRFDAIGDDGLTGADVALGFIGGGSLGAVAPFRGHMLIHALAGSGKTTMMAYLQAVLSALAGDVIDDFTEAGLRTDLAGMARPVLLDEAEAKADQPGGGAAERMLELIRRMSTGKGAQRKQGSRDGSEGAVTQTAVGCVAFAAINPPRLSGQDVTRVVEVRLLPLAGDADRPLATDEDIEAATERAKAMAPALLGRALRSAWRYRSDAALVKAALKRSGQSPRSADLIAMLAAGRRLLLFDEALTPETAEAEAALWLPLLMARETQGRVENPGADALGHLLAWDSGQHSKDRRASLGELIGRNVDKAEKGHFDDVLKAHGVMTWQDEQGVPWLLVSNHHPGLERIFKGTPWQDWGRALVNLDALGEEFATKPVKPRRWGNQIKQRGIAIPLTPVLENPHRVATGWGGGTGGGTPSVPGEDIDWDGET